MLFFDFKPCTAATETAAAQDEIEERAEARDLDSRALPANDRSRAETGLTGPVSLRELMMSQTPAE